MTGFEVDMTLEEVSVVTKRKLIIPSEITFEKLHETISLVFNLQYKNKYQFIIDEINLIIKNTQKINRDTIDSRYEKIDKYFQALTTLTYVNDFWKIILDVKEVSYDKKYPQIIHTKGFYNPLPEIRSSDEFSNILEMKSNITEAGSKELKIIRKLRRINKLKIQKQLMFLYNVPYKVTNRKIVEIKKVDTLESFF